MNGAERAALSSGVERDAAAGRLGAMFAIAQRELLQSARDARGVAWVCAATVLLAVVVTTAAALLAPKWDAAELGQGLYQLSFTLGLGVVCLWGTALGARLVRNELSQRTWPYLQLSCASVRQLVWGKWLAAWLQVSLWVVAASPLAALPYLCGGVHAGEIAIGVALLLWAAAGACAVGVAAAACRPRWAPWRLLPGLCGLGLAVLSVGALGYLGSLLARQAFPGLPSGPFWFAAAYTHAQWDLADVSLLIMAPLAASVSLGAGAVELCAARLSPPDPRRLAGVKGWSIGCALVALSVGFMLRTWLVARDTYHWASVTSIAALNCLGFLLLWMLSAERTSELDTRPGLLRAWRASGLFASTRFVWRLATFGTLLAFCAGALQELHSGRVLAEDPRSWLYALAAFTVSQLLFAYFAVGLVRLLRIRYPVAATRRRFALVVLGFWFFPWLLALVLGAFDKLQNWLWLAALSPGYAFTLAHQLRDRFSPLDLPFWVHVGSGLVWLGAGLASTSVARRTLAADSKGVRE